jgi:hypothetical protein
VMFDAFRGNRGIGLSADGLDNEVGWSAIDATVERFTHHILGDAEGEELVVALDVGDDCVEGLCVVGEDSGCG